MMMMMMNMFKARLPTPMSQTILTMSPAAQQVKQLLADIEAVAEEILADKEQVIDLDKKRQKNREALRALQKMEDVKGRPWICIGNMFMKMPNDHTKELLEKEQATLETEIQNLRKKMKRNVQQLREMEGKPEARGFDLQPLSKDEMRAVHKVLGQ
ncbi:p53 and DNA damage-regulated protein 1-like isoform X3 [Ornithodoros turicata]|uniref:p53 and DNA damage-regulated protein 1-like isoform X3 n=1 Tax=Ornithodoros turicata TaxID=34597 RepID=UPI003138E59C